MALVETGASRGNQPSDSLYTEGVMIKVSPLQLMIVRLLCTHSMRRLECQCQIAVLSVKR